MKPAKIMEINQPSSNTRKLNSKTQGSQVLVKVQSYEVYHKNIYLLEGAYEIKPQKHGGR